MDSKRESRNQIDRKWIKKWGGALSQEQRDICFEVFYPFVLSLSDTQLASGLAVLSIGLFRLSKGDLSTYHFNIIQDLAWLASNSHLLSLEVIRRWLVDRQNRCEARDHQPQSRRGPYFLLRTIRF